MKLEGLKYILIACIALTFVLKVSRVVSYLSYSTDNVEVLSTSDDATEKEEKKIETEYAIQETMFHGKMYFPLQTSKKVIVPDCSLQLAYFPEVLTPPPSI
ncbi:hypothetical protein FFJ24_024050 [Pedobacter sp. KBS0701]|uniref:hypothetical protein n=1 Tax=Pedobacter sp. KBS0701 TaxID=2578106 RepID=UPI00110D73BC|nr:hypothetical protein [Pedobacter sp. KBS0701]QDW27743.1 hypothetical protein FFJ24_024050 [Pedobacter sp. KBS0701]